MKCIIDAFFNINIIEIENARHCGMPIETEILSKSDITNG